MGYVVDKVTLLGQGFFFSELCPSPHYVSTSAVYAISIRLPTMLYNRKGRNEVRLTENGDEKEFVKKGDL